MCVCVCVCVCFCVCVCLNTIYLASAASMAHAQANPYTIHTSTICFNTASFEMSDGSHVPNWPQIMPKLRRFWEEYAKYPINFMESIENDGAQLGKMINETVLGDFNEWQQIKHRLEIANEVLDQKLNNTDVVDLVLADYQRDLHLVEARLEADYHSINRKLRRASRETWPYSESYRQGINRFKVRLSDEIRALADEICDDMCRGDRDMSWVWK